MWVLVSVITVKLGQIKGNPHQSKAEATLCIECGLLWFLIISHIIQFEATFCMTSKENPYCRLNVAAVTIVTNPYNPHRSHIWKT